MSGWIKGAIALALILAVVYGIHRFGDFEYAAGDTAGQATVQKTFDAYQRDQTAALLASNKAVTDATAKAAAAQTAADAAYLQGKADAKAVDAPTIAGLTNGTISLRVALATATHAISSGKLCGTATTPCGPVTSAAASLSGPAATATHQYCDDEFNAVRLQLIEANAVIASDRQACGSQTSPPSH